MRAIPWPVLMLLALGACAEGATGRAILDSLGVPGDAEPDRLAIAEAESADAEAAAGPARLRVALGRRNASAVLVQQQGARRMWRAPGGVVVATDGPRVVATAGLPTIIMGTRFDGPDPLEDPVGLMARPAEARRLVDLAGAARDPGSMRFGLAFDCRLRAARTDEPGVVLVEERCRVSGGGSVTNLFWADEASGRVTHAEQWVGTGLAPMVIAFP